MIERVGQGPVPARRCVGICALAAAAVLAIGACATTRSDPRFASVDWHALEASQVSSAPIEVLPEIDPFGLRVPLVTVEKTRVTGTDMTRHTVVDHPVSPVGVLFGNGLAVDTEGNIFLDVLALLHVDLHEDFDLRVDEGRLRRNGDSLQLFEPLSAPAAVTIDDTAVTLKAGLNRWGYTIDGGSYKYTSPGLLGATYDVSAGTGSVTLTAWKIFSTTYTVTLVDQAATFAPYYKVAKRGDAYHIDGMGDNLKSYTLYIDGARMIFCEGNTVLHVVDLGDGAVLVDGRRVVTYTHGQPPG